MGLNSLKAYEEDFEAPLLHETAQFYRRESAKWITEDSCPSYMIKAENRLKEELVRAQTYLHSSTEPNLIKQAEIELIAQHQRRLLEMENSGFILLLQDYKTDG
jgi:cullin 1